MTEAAALWPSRLTPAPATPSLQSTTYVQESVDEYLAKGYSYSRTNNPTVTVLENKIAELEGGYGALLPPPPPPPISPLPPSPPVFTATLTAAANLAATAFPRPPSRPPLPTPPRL